MEVTGRDIVDEARKWLKTPFHPQARLRGIGCDCFGLIVGVARDLSLLSNNGERFECCDVIGYRYMRDSILLHEELPKHLVTSTAITLGGIIVFKIVANHFHVGIISALDDADTNNSCIIHCCSSVGMVVENRISKQFSEKIVHKLVFPGVKV